MGISNKPQRSDPFIGNLTPAGKTHTLVKCLILIGQHHSEGVHYVSTTGHLCLLTTPKSIQQKPIRCGIM